MEPIKPETVARILAERPNVTTSDIREFLRLQSEHFMTNPFAQKSPEEEEEEKKREERIQELYSKIYK